MGLAILLGMRRESLLLQSSPNEILLLRSLSTGAFQHFSGKIGRSFNPKLPQDLVQNPGLFTSNRQLIHLCNEVNKLYKCSVSKRKVHKMVWHIKLAMQMGAWDKKSEEREKLRGDLVWE